MRRSPTLSITSSALARCAGSDTERLSNATVISCPSPNNAAARNPNDASRSARSITESLRRRSRSSASPSIATPSR